MRQYLQVVTNTTTPLPTSRWKTSDQNVRPQVSQLITAGYFLSFKKNIYELTLESTGGLRSTLLTTGPGPIFCSSPTPKRSYCRAAARRTALRR